MAGAKGVSGCCHCRLNLEQPAGAGSPAAASHQPPWAGACTSMTSGLRRSPVPPSHSSSLSLLGPPPPSITAVHHPRPLDECPVGGRPKSYPLRPSRHCSREMSPVLLRRARR